MSISFQNAGRVARFEAEMSRLPEPAEAADGRGCERDVPEERRRREERPVRMARLTGSAGERIHARRKSTVEPVFGIIGTVLGFGRFGMVCTARNRTLMRRPVNRTERHDGQAWPEKGKFADVNRMCRQVGLSRRESVGRSRSRFRLRLNDAN